MTKKEFTLLCSSYTIDPAVALENENVVQLLRDIKTAGSDNAKSGYRNLLIRVLETEF